MAEGVNETSHGEPAKTGKEKSPRRGRSHSYPVTLTPPQVEFFDSFLAASLGPDLLRRRVRMVLMIARGNQTDTAIARQLEVSNSAVAACRRRFHGRGINTLLAKCNAIIEKEETTRFKTATNNTSATVWEEQAKGLDIEHERRGLPLRCPLTLSPRGGPPRHLYPVTLTPPQVEFFDSFLAAGLGPDILRKQIRAVLMMARDDQTDTAIARQLEASNSAVTAWRKRFHGRGIDELSSKCNAVAEKEDMATFEAAMNAMSATVWEEQAKGLDVEQAFKCWFYASWSLRLLHYGEHQTLHWLQYDLPQIVEAYLPLTDSVDVLEQPPEHLMKQSSVDRAKAAALKGDPKKVHHTAYELLTKGETSANNVSVAYLSAGFGLVISEYGQFEGQRWLQRKLPPLLEESEHKLSQIMKAES